MNITNIGLMSESHHLCLDKGIVRIETLL